VVIVYPILETSQMAAIGPVTGLGFLCCGPAHCDVNQPLKARRVMVVHRVDEGSLDPLLLDARDEDREGVVLNGRDSDIALLAAFDSGNE
jgi:hypothetical protein